MAYRVCFVAPAFPEVPITLTLDCPNPTLVVRTVLALHLLFALLNHAEDAGDG